MQPAQPAEQFFVVLMNIAGLVFMTWISGNIAVLISDLGKDSNAY